MLAYFDYRSGYALHLALGLVVLARLLQLHLPAALVRAHIDHAPVSLAVALVEDLVRLQAAASRSPRHSSSFMLHDHAPCPIQVEKSSTDGALRTWTLPLWRVRVPSSATSPAVMMPSVLSASLAMPFLLVSICHYMMAYNPKHPSNHSHLELLERYYVPWLQAGLSCS